MQNTHIITLYFHITTTHRKSVILDEKRKLKHDIKPTSRVLIEQLFPQVRKGLYAPQTQSVKETDVRWEIPPCAKSYKQKG